MRRYYPVKKRCSYTRYILILFSTFILFCGCAKPPSQEVENAKKALEEARAIEADVYVKDVFQRSEEALKKAQGLIADKKYKEAKVAAEEATNLAFQAISMVEKKKTIKSEETDEMLISAQKLMEEVKVLASTAIREKAIDKKDKIQCAIGQHELDMVRIKELIQAQKIHEAHNQLSALMEQMTFQKKTISSALNQKLSTEKS